MAVTHDSDRLRAEILAMIGDGQRITRGAVARDIGLGEETLAEWLAGDYRGNLRRVEDLVAKYLENREAWKAATRRPDGKTRQQLRQALFLKMGHLISELVREAGVSRKAEQIEQQAGLAMADMEHLATTSEGAASHQCWRCGASLAPPAPEVEVQIEANERAAAWAGWTPELFRARCREKMKPGDRICGVRRGAVTIQGADGSLFEIGRLDG